MKKIFLSGFLALITFGFVFAYEQQGFDSYIESNGSVSFQCTTQCFILLGSTSENELINIIGSIQGNGVLGYGFLVGNQIYQGDGLQINGSTNPEQEFILSSFPSYSQLPSDSQAILMFQGEFIGNQIIINGGAMGVFDKIGQGRKDFWKIEPITPYSINLRYGVNIFGKSIIWYGYLFFIFTSIYIFLSKKYKKNRNKILFYLGFGIFLFIGIRNLITYTNITYEGLKNYTFQKGDNKLFFELGDYITFTDKIRKKLNLDIEKNKNCKIYIDSYQDRPFNPHRKILYLKPCNVILTGSEANYIIYFKKPVMEGDIEKQILIDFNGSYLLQNK